MSIRLCVVAVLVFPLACGCSPRHEASGAKAARATASAPVPAPVTLTNPVGITILGGVFSPLIPAGQALPVVHSETFGNATNGKSEVMVELSQQSAAGTETITSLRIPIPPAANRTLDITVTISISADKQMTVKTTVAQTAATQQFGPFPVK